MRGTARETGAVHVLYGHPSGLDADPRGTALDDQYVTLASAGGLELGAPVGEASNDRFGEAVALGDLDADGIDDLILGMPGLYVDDQERAGGDRRSCSAIRPG